MKSTARLRLAALLGLSLATSAHAGADNFVNATNLNDNNWPAAVSILTYTAETNEPGHRPDGTVGTQKSAWWKWTAPANGFCTLDTMGMFDELHVYDTILAVYTGSSVDALTRVAANNNNQTALSYASNGAASVTFYAEEGTTYHIAIDGRIGASVNANNHKVAVRLRHLYAEAEQRIGGFGIPEDDFMQGRVQLTKTAGHAFSGKLTLNGKTYPFKGVFGIDGYASFSIERKVAPGTAPQPPLTLLLDGTRHSEFALVSHLYNGAWYSELHTQQVFGKGATSGLKGRYTASVSRNSSSWNGGALCLTVAGNGIVKGAGVLPDGTKITYGSTLCVNDSGSSWVPVYTSLYKNQGYFNIDLKLTEAGEVDHISTESVDSEYFRPADPESVFLPDGYVFFSSVVAVGSTYTPPAADSRALGFLDGTAGAGSLSIPMVSGEIDPAIMENLTLSTANAFGFLSNTRKPVLKFNKGTGMVTGSLLDDEGKKRSLTGILYLDGMTPKLSGHVSGTTKNAFFEVVP